MSKLFICKAETHIHGEDSALTTRDVAKQSLSRCLSDVGYVWDRAAELRAVFKDGFVLYGYGNVGRRTAHRLNGSDFKLLDVVDRFKVGDESGINILSLSMVAAKYGHDIPIVVSIWQGGTSTLRFEDIHQDLRNLGFTKVFSVLDLYWTDPQRFLPYLICDDPQKTLVSQQDIFKAIDLLDDEESLEILLTHVQFRLSGDFALLKRSLGVEYFDSFANLGAPIRLLDCGAYDGDTIRSGILAGVAFDNVVAVEPDPDNVQRLRKWASASEVYDKVQVVEAAISSQPGYLSFSANGDMTSSLGGIESGNPASQVKVITVDQICDDLSWAPTHIKMDIEGSERDALQGAIKTLEKIRPTLMISLEHAYDDLWAIPNLINSIVGSYRFAIRHYSEAGFDAVLYAVPDVE